MTPDELRTTCLNLNGTAEEYPFPRHPEVCTFKVGGKIFALTTLTASPLTVSLKCDPELAVRLRSAHPEIVPGYHLNKRHWNTVTLEGGSLPDTFVREMIEDSYDLIVAALPRAKRLLLDWPGERTERSE